MSDPQPLPFRIVTWIGIIDQLAGSAANRLLAPLDLPLPQFILLNHLSYRPGTESGGHTIMELARALQQPQPGITKTVQKLVDKGFLAERGNPRDGRSKLLRMTARGAAAHQAAIEALMPELARAFAGWSAEEMRRLFADLDRLKLWLDADRDR
ncbi:MAG: winged helix-turn-helix transcriptional regulator [Alphaproteobacteria bacterium]|nr:winged helix-turn-helix transcriptional regulator [Alphaproteobacteria bacterium]MCW5742013.1 winged helix-turn-helix transcriptional regulator [Alphaproteobacteria bacterium]